MGRDTVKIVGEKTHRVRCRGVRLDQRNRAWYAVPRCEGWSPTQAVPKARTLDVGPRRASELAKCALESQPSIQTKVQCRQK